MLTTVNDVSSGKLLGKDPRTKEDINILGPRSKTQSETDRLADYMVQTFSSPDYLPAFLKIAWRLDTGTIHNLVGKTKEANSRNPRGYFITCAKNEMKRRGVA